jgi:hypothetical protein
MNFARLRLAARSACPMSFGLAALAAVGLVAAAPERGDPRARLSRADAALEYWDLAARFETGQRLVARVLVTNEGPGEQTAVGVGHLILPDGEVVAFRNGRLRGRWVISADGQSLRIGSTELALGPPVRRLDYDNDRRGIEIHLRLHVDGPARFQRSGEWPEYRVDVLDLAAPVEGTILLPGMPAPLAISGRAAFVHTWMDRSEPSLVARRIDFASLDPGAAVYLRDVTTPEGKHHRWLVALGEFGIVERSDFEVELEPRAGSPANEGYPLPAGARLRGPGLAASVTFGHKLLEHDPLGDLPQPFRFLLSFAMRPRRVWTDSPYSLRLDAAAGRAALAVDGSGIASVTYLNPLASPEPGS